MGSDQRDCGLLIAFEGIDGAGTTTQTRRLAVSLGALGRDVHETRQPSRGPIGRLIREMLAGSHAPVDVAAMALLFAADRVDHFHREVLPALGHGQIVISDRWYHSSLAYQGLDCDPGWVATINGEAMRPDLTVFLRVGPEAAEIRRQATRGASDIYETREFQQRVATAYAEVFDGLAGFEDIVIINGERDPSLVAREVLHHARVIMKRGTDRGPRPLLKHWRTR